MPPSARRADITPTLGSGRLGVVGAPPPKPGCIPTLDMVAIAAAREAEEAEAAEEAAAEAAAAQHHLEGQRRGVGPDDEEEDDEDDDDDTDEDDGGGGWSRPPAVPSLVPKLGAAPKASYQEEFEAHEAAAAAAAAGAPEAFDTSAIDAMLYAKDPSRR